MEARDRRMLGNVLYAAAAVIFLAVAIYLVVVLVLGVDALGTRDRLLSVLTGATIVGLGAIFGGWRLDREAAASRHEAEAKLRAEIDAQHAAWQASEGDRARLESEVAARDTAIDERSAELAAAREAHESDLRQRDEKHAAEVRRRDDALDQERRVRQRVERARSAEQEWNRELRGQVLRMHAERGALGDTSDVRDLVLRLALTLLGAEKGMLLSREDQDADGRLDLVAHQGFERDPGQSAVAQRFATEVLERDTTLREDDPGELEATPGAPVDEEIRNLVAIPIYVQDEFNGVVVCANKDGGFREYDDDVLLSLGDHAGAVLENGRLHSELRGSYLATVTMLAEAIQAKDPFLRGHSDEVSGYVAAVADRLGLEPKRREQLVFASLLHDVGKIGISERILLKPARLTSEEYSVVQLHPRIGYRLVEQVPALKPMAPAILHHHERFDGDGYPARLRGEQIPLEARIICVADSFSAMTAERPYAGRKSLEEACEELESCAGSQFDPEVVRIFVEEVRKRPPEGEETFSGVLADPEIAVRRDGDEPVLGHGTLAVVDNLTLLYTHRYFHEVASSEAERAALQNAPFSVVVVELTDISNLNRSEGYAAGDAAIRSVAHAVQRAAVRCGGTAARYGGPCLGLLAPGTDEAGVVDIVADLARDRGGPPVEVSAATWRPGETGEEVIARARVALTAVRDGLPEGPPASSAGLPTDVASPPTGAGARSS